MRIRERTRGYLAVVLAAVLFGVWPSLSKLVLNAVHPLVIALLIQLIPAIALSPSLRRVRIARSDWKLIALSSFVGAVIGPITYFYGLERTTASNSVLLSNSESLFTIMLAYTFLGERATRREYLALGGIAVGAFLVTTQL
ncbi:MAG: DMT family transporter, partial [Thermoplasmata archaeon]